MPPGEEFVALSLDRTVSDLSIDPVLINLDPAALNLALAATNSTTMPIDEIVSADPSANNDMSVNEHAEDTILDSPLSPVAETTSWAALVENDEANANSTVGNSTDDAVAGTSTGGFTASGSGHRIVRSRSSSSESSDSGSKRSCIRRDRFECDRPRVTEPSRVYYDDRSLLSIRLHDLEKQTRRNFHGGPTYLMLAEKCRETARRLGISHYQPPRGRSESYARPSTDFYVQMEISRLQAENERLLRRPAFSRCPMGRSNGKFRPSTFSF